MVNSCSKLCVPTSAGCNGAGLSWAESEPSASCDIMSTSPRSLARSPSKICLNLVVSSIKPFRSAFFTGVDAAASGFETVFVVTAFAAFFTGFSAATFFAGNFFAGAFLATGFFTTDFLTVTDFFFVVVFFGDTGFLLATFLLLAFLGVAFLLTAFFGAGFFEAAFLAVVFFATLLFVAAFFFAAEDFTAFLAADFFAGFDFAAAFFALATLEDRFTADFLALAFFALGFLADFFVTRFLALKLAYPLNWGFYPGRMVGKSWFYVKLSSNTLGETPSHDSDPLRYNANNDAIRTLNSSNRWWYGRHPVGRTHWINREK